MRVFRCKVGLGLSYSLTITRTLSFGVRSSTAMENQFNAVERVQQFMGLEQEEDLQVCDHSDADIISAFFFLLTVVQR